MMYKVIRMFTDLQDGNYEYHVGDAFPRQGVSASEARFAELSGRNNRQGVPLIEAVPEPETTAPAEETADDTADDVEAAEKPPADEPEAPKRKKRKD